jgi:hypothetical protein
MRLIERDPAAVLGVGCFRVGAEPVLHAFSEADRARDARSCEGLLALAGVGRGDDVLIVSMLSEAASYWPLLGACVARGARLSAADATPFDASRVRMFCRQLPLRAILGLHPSTLAGLRQLGADLAEVLRAVPVLGARPGAREELEALGLRPRLWLQVGPALALECAPGSGAHLDPGLWQAEAGAGEILITSRAPRLTPLARQRTGLRGRVEPGPCACGRSGDRIHLDA